MSNPGDQTLTLDQALQLALQHHRANQLDQAEHIYIKILEVLPNHPDVLHLLGHLKRAKGQTPQAIELMESALQHASPAPVHFLTNLSLAYYDARRPADAERVLRQAIEIDPNNFDAHSTLGTIFDQTGRLNEAIASYTRAREINPNEPNVHSNLCFVYQKLNRLDEAIAAGQRSVELNPNFPMAWNNLGIALVRSARIAEAENAWQNALKLAPNFGDAHLNVSLALLLQGKLQPGWVEHEWRRRSENVQSKPQQVPGPQWTGQPLHNQTILLHHEQGFGDTIQFIRYAPLIKARGAKVVIDVPQPLHRLFQSIPGIDKILPPGQPTHYHYQVAMLSIPLAFNTSLESIPAGVPYLSVPQDLIETWKNRVAQHDTGKLKIGLAWAGSPIHHNDRSRSMTIQDFAPLAQFADRATFFNLQIGPRKSELKDAPPGLDLIDLTDEITDFADTGALLHNLDLVITVDTALCHLAGALGRPVWTLITYIPDWRWMMDRSDSPWYRTMRLFRQTKAYDWSSAIEQVVDALYEMSKKETRTK